MTTPTLTEFLLARIAEDERRAAAAVGRLHARRKDATLADRAVTEAQSKRAIVGIHFNANSDWQPGSVPPICDVCHDYSKHDAATWPCGTLRLLAVPYADHPDCDEDWRA